jgi:hypothetical protein
MSGSIPLRLIEDIPDHVVSSVQMSGWFQMNAGLEELSRQAAALAVREWFQEKQDWSASFRISLDTSEGVVIISPVRDDRLSSGQWVAIQQLVRVIEGHVNYHAWPLINHLIVMLNALSWNASMVDKILVDVLDKHTKMEGAKLLALVDASRLRDSTEVVDTVQVPSRL